MNESSHIVENVAFIIGIIIVIITVKLLAPSIQAASSKSFGKPLNATLNIRNVVPPTKFAFIIIIPQRESYIPRACIMRSSLGIDPTIGKIIATITTPSIILQILKSKRAVIYATRQVTAMFTNEHATA